MNPLHPLTYGTVLIAGGKTTNFPAEIVQHPRVIMWQSQDKQWEGKELPSNVRAILVTKWLGHSEWVHLQREARKKRVTLFTPTGTGLITKNVKELLGMNGTEETKIHHFTVKLPETMAEAKKMTDTSTPIKHKGKLKPLADFVDVTKSDGVNGEILLAKAKELGIPTTLKSTIVFSSREKRKLRGHIGRGPARVTKTVVTSAKTFPKYENDAAVEIFDNIIKELKDVREYLVKTTDENRMLRTRIEKFKNFLETE